MPHFQPFEAENKLFRIRKATVTDVMGLIALRRHLVTTSAFSLTTPSELNDDLEAQQNWIKTFRPENGHLLIVAEADDKIIGVLNFNSNLQKRNRHTGEFGMGVDMDWQGKGIGTSLLNALIEWAEKHNILEKICLRVFEDNDIALRLYRKMGFIEEGRLVNAIKLEDGSYRDGIMMYRWVGKL